VSRRRSYRRVACLTAGAIALGGGATAIMVRTVASEPTKAAAAGTDTTVLPGATATFAIESRAKAASDAIPADIAPRLGAFADIPNARRAQSVGNVTVWVLPAPTSDAICLLAARLTAGKSSSYVMNCPSRAYAAAGQVLLPVPSEGAGNTVAVGLAPDGIGSISALGARVRVTGNTYVLDVTSGGIGNPNAGMPQTVTYQATSGAEQDVGFSWVPPPAATP
jgi:hypothetical protein